MEFLISAYLNFKAPIEDKIGDILALLQTIITFFIAVVIIPICHIWVIFQKPYILGKPTFI